MLDKIDILAIDDDKFILKLIVSSLQSKHMSVRTAPDGNSGIKEAIRQVPNIILLDVEMPGINGFEVCDKLRNIEATKDIPIIFLSSHSSLRERLQGYEAGADDYLTKPFETEHLLARINVLINYHKERQELRKQYEIAKKTAMTAMTGSSELGQAMEFLEKSFIYQTIEDLSQGFFESTDQLSLDCCMMMIVNEKPIWYSSEGSISPLEKELIEINDRDTRFLNFGFKTIINYPLVSLLVKNMPLDNMERYGRLKDLLPILVSAVNTKINILITQEGLAQQSQNLMGSFKMIRQNLYLLGSTIVKNRNDSRTLMSELVTDISNDLLRMGLEEDQEEYLLNRIDSAIEEAMEKTDAGQELREALSFILNNLKTVMNKQEVFLGAYTASLTSESTDNNEGIEDNIEFF